MRDPAAHRMGRRPRYYEPSSVVAVRLPEALRRVLEYLVATTGAETLSGYLRAVVEEHLRSLGFEPEPGVHTPVDWAKVSPERLAAWQKATLRARHAGDNCRIPVDGHPAAPAGDQYRPVTSHGA